MQRCHHCGALQALEAVLCVACDGYIGRLVAQLGAGVVKGPPLVEVPDVYDARLDGGAPAEPARQPDWEKPVRRPGGTKVAVGYTVVWKSTGPGRPELARVRALGKEWQLSSGLKLWSVCLVVKVGKIAGLYQVKSGLSRGDQLAGRVAAERGLAEEIQRIMENGKTWKGEYRWGDGAWRRNGE